VHLKSPNAIDPAQTYTAFLISVVAGARRFAHTSLLRADQAFARGAGDESDFPPTARFGICSSGFTQWDGGGDVRARCGAWQGGALAARGRGLQSGSWNSTVFERYGKQEGVKRGLQPAPSRAGFRIIRCLAVCGRSVLHFARLACVAGNTTAGRGW